MGIPVKATHMGLMLALALSTVASLEAVGVILVVAMFVFPPVTAAFFLQRLPAILIGTFPLGIIYTWGGFHLAHWLDCSIAAAIAVVATLLFIPACLLGPNGGILWRLKFKT
jgi:ABC-type Mn2+/Zn2+ transport system permease subunit